MPTIPTELVNVTFKAFESISVTTALTIIDKIDAIFKASEDVESVFHLIDAMGVTFENAEEIAVTFKDAFTEPSTIMPQRQKTDICMYQGDKAVYKFSVFTDDAKTIPYDMSLAASCTMSVKKTLDSTDVLFSKSTADGVDSSSFVAGIVYFTFTKDQTKLLDRNGKYDVQVNFSNAPETVVYGDVVLQRQVTPT